MPRDAAAVILWRKDPLRVFWVRRGSELRFSGGFHAFPGGAVDAGDPGLPATTPDPAAAGAARELFEETGVLLLDGPLPPPEERRAWRRALLEGKPVLRDALAARGLRLDTARLADAGRWVTPHFSPVRFDAKFFLAELPEGQDAEVWPGELADGEWIEPREALARWETGAALMHPPAVHALRCLAEDGPLASDRLRAPVAPDHVARRIEFQKNVHVVPLRAPTLPPATHTNCFILGAQDLWVVDPGSPYEDEQKRLAAVLASLLAEGRRLRGIVITHEHADHHLGLQALLSAFPAPLLAHPFCARALAPDVRVNRELRHGETLETGGALALRVLHTPGHTRGHLCLHDEASRALFAGDMVANGSTIIVSPPEGDMGEYMSSLHRLDQLGVRTLYPAHGMPIPDGPAKLREYIAHREAREGKVVDALRAGAATLAEIVKTAYDDTPEAAWPLAERSALAILNKLAREGRAAHAEGAGWRPAAG